MPRDQNGNILYDSGVTLLDTWWAIKGLADHGKCRAIGLSDISLNELLPIYESARIKPAMVQVEAHPYLPETELLEFCKENDIVFLAFAPLGHGIRPGPLEDPVISAIAARVGKTPAQVLLALGGAARHGFAYHAQDCGPGAGEFRYLRSSGRRA